LRTYDSSKKLISLKIYWKNYPKYLIENIYLATMGAGYIRDRVWIFLI